jgi:RNA polymerase sigma-54 factor
VQVQRPEIIQTQKLRMSPQLYQSIKLMAMPIVDLRLRIQEEVEANPALEILEDGTTVSMDEVEGSKPDEYDPFENSSDKGYDDEAGDAKRRFMEGALSRPESLHDHLLWQLRLQPISEVEFEVGELLILNLDDNGFYREPPEATVPEGMQEHLEKMIGMIRTFDPVGTCVADYRESLIVQSRLAGIAPPWTEEILADHFETLERGRYAEIAKKLKIDEEDVEEALEFIRGLTPFPGREFSSDSTTYVVPDLLVKEKDGEFVIVLNDEEIPVLGIDPFFDDIAKKKAAEKEGPEVKRFAKGRVKDARWFINSIHQRNQTLFKVSRAIVRFQEEFFRKGPKYLKPLTLKDVAAEVDVHEATVSRITTSKHIQTEWGIFELKYFFSNSISGSGSDGSRFSKEAVKEIMKELLEELENSEEKHLSDQKISELLKTRGISIARRTVAKYRKELAISSSYER